MAGGQLSQACGHTMQHATSTKASQIALQPRQRWAGKTSQPATRWSVTLAINPTRAKPRQITERANCRSGGEHHLVWFAGVVRTYADEISILFFHCLKDSFLPLFSIFFVVSERMARWFWPRLSSLMANRLHCFHCFNRTKSVQPVSHQKTKKTHFETNMPQHNNLCTRSQHATLPLDTSKKLFSPAPLYVYKAQQGLSTPLHGFICWCTKNSSHFLCEQKFGIVSRVGVRVRSNVGRRPPAPWNE